tara:strand:+ start:146 stop:880 length:735 start_codon:yes stop_codon:yes gene_type:complete
MANTKSNTANRAGDSGSDTVVSSETVQIARHLIDARESAKKFNATHGESVKAISDQLDEIFVTAWRELVEKDYEEFHDEFSKFIRNRSWLAVYKAGQMASTVRCIDALEVMGSLVKPAFRDVPQMLREVSTDYDFSRNGGIFEKVADEMADADQARLKEISQAIENWAKDKADRKTSKTFSQAMADIEITAGNKAGKKGKNKNSGNSIKPETLFTKYQNMATADRKKFIKLILADDTFIKETSK